MTACLAEPDPTHTDDTDIVVHLVCTDHADRSLCGLDLTGAEWAEPGDAVDCVVCRDLTGKPCEVTCAGGVS